MIDKVVDFLASDRGKALTVMAMLGTYALSSYVSFLNKEKAEIELRMLRAEEAAKFPKAA